MARASPGPTSRSSRCLPRLSQSRTRQRGQVDASPAAGTRKSLCRITDAAEGAVQHTSGVPDGVALGHATYRAPPSLTWIHPPNKSV